MTTNNERLLYTPERAADVLDHSRTKVWELLRTGELTSIKVGKRRLIFADSIDAYVTRLKAQAETPGDPP